MDLRNHTGRRKARVRAHGIDQATVNQLYPGHAPENSDFERSGMQKSKFLLSLVQQKFRRYRDVCQETAEHGCCKSLQSCSPALVRVEDREITMFWTCSA